MIRVTERGQGRLLGLTLGLGRSGVFDRFNRLRLALTGVLLNFVIGVEAAADGAQSKLVEL
jgi:hypothetical protein